MYCLLLFGAAVMAGIYLPFGQLMIKRYLEKLTRLHHSGTQAVVRKHVDGCWRINLDIHGWNQKPLAIVGYLAPSEEKARELADTEILRHSHVCNASCKGWERVY